MGGTPAGAPLLFGPPPCRHWGFYLYLILIEHFHVRSLIDEGVNGMENTSHPFSGAGGGYNSGEFAGQPSRLLWS